MVDVYLGRYGTPTYFWPYNIADPKKFHHLDEIHRSAFVVPAWLEWLEAAGKPVPMVCFESDVWWHFLWYLSQQNIPSMCPLRKQRKILSKARSNLNPLGAMNIWTQLAACHIITGNIPHIVKTQFLKVEFIVQSLESPCFMVRPNVKAVKISFIVSLILTSLPSLFLDRVIPRFVIVKPLPLHPAEEMSFFPWCAELRSRAHDAGWSMATAETATDLLQGWLSLAQPLQIGWSNTKIAGTYGCSWALTCSKIWVLSHPYVFHHIFKSRFHSSHDVPTKNWL